MQRLEVESHNRLSIAGTMQRLGLHDHNGSIVEITVANSIEEFTMLMDFPLLYGWG